jgi:CRP/FNR family transcriptional regulator, cyclic AMP receptor protein
MKKAWAKVPILAGMSDEAVELLTQRSKAHIHPQGDVILREGEIGNRSFVIAQGEVAVFKHYQAFNEVRLAVIKKGDFFGEMCILETLPRTATVIAATQCRLYSLSSLDFYHLYEALPKEYAILILNMARDLSRRLRHLDDLFAARH